MKKLFLIPFFAAGIFVLWSHGEMLWSNRLFLDEPRVHKIEKGEYLSKLAQKYYGDPQRWRELALINRAPNPNHAEIGEEILVPAANAVSEMSRAHTLTQVNALVNEQQKLATREPSKTPVITETTPTTTPEVTTDNGTTAPREPVVETPAPAVTEPVATETEFPWRWIGAGAVLLVLASVGFMLYRRRQTRNANAAIAVRKRESSFDDFRHRRQYGENAASKTASVDEDDDAKDNASGLEESRSRRRHGEGTTATA